ncbi:glycosyl transferase [Serpentinicella sp. ANB-PHB4]|uniref:glycosyl transferase n=1 Tax=Serpentinicella sp. ANB-PHB4 TaxID=3074076 RepID=UPI002859B6B9|nr:glycosyl transferase [Serpentinicella sp. ANB-PHB4]MDR5658174.1 glycosyl transferase [Serpentinicella sp. ANB-PHB4]
MHILFFLITILTTLLIKQPISKLISRKKRYARNYRGELVPCCMGVVYPLVTIITFLFLISTSNQNIVITLCFLFSIIAMSFIGLLDDLMGDRTSLGFKGHLRACIKGDITTGFLKLIFGGLVAVVVSLILSNCYYSIFINAIIIALSCNFINLMDLRPGRALKIIIIILAIFILTAESNLKPYIYIILGFAITYFPQDIKGLSMMGDVGSNSLGVSIGIIMSISYSLNARIVIMIFLLLMHIITERYSLTKIIEGNSILNFLDKLGQNNR